MVNKRIVSEKIKYLAEIIRELQEYAKFTQKEVVENTIYFRASERALQLAIEIVLDIGNHIISDESLMPRPDNYQEVFDTLKQNDVISKELAHDFEGAAKFRNLLIHEYIKIDPTRIYEYLQKAPKQFNAFSKEIIQYIS